jgi:hypothetical protein
VNVGELLRPGSPCRLYSDLEWYEDQRCDARDRARLELFLRTLAAAVAKTTGTRPRVAIASGSRLKDEHVWKASYHVVVTNILVQDNRDTRVVDRICALAGEDPLFVSEQDGKPTRILDTSVYTKNRNFRIPGSLKDAKNPTGLVPFFLEPDSVPAVDLVFGERGRVYTRQEQLQAMLIKLRDSEPFVHGEWQPEGGKEKKRKKSRGKAGPTPDRVQNESAAELQVRAALERWLRLSRKARELGWSDSVVLTYNGTFGARCASMPPCAPGTASTGAPATTSTRATRTIAGSCTTTEHGLPSSQSALPTGRTTRRAPGTRFGWGRLSFERERWWERVGVSFHFYKMRMANTQIGLGASWCMMLVVCKVDTVCFV